jgi:TPR repeat protein
MRTISLHCLIVLLALAAGKSNADYQQGLDAFSIGEYETALAEWAPLAEQGHAESQFGMGLLCANGWGTAQNDAEALKWYELAAAQGHGEAQFNIGVMYQNGWGVDQSDAEALRWMQASAESGFPAAHRTLGGIYESGIGVAMDAQANTTCGTDGDVSLPGSPVRILAIRAREDLSILKAVLHLVQTPGARRN